MELQFPQLSKLILLTGKIASGKTTVSQLLSKFLNFQHVIISDFLKSDLNKIGKEITRENLQFLGERYYKDFGELYFIYRTLELALSTYNGLIIDGIRYPEGVKILKDYYKANCILVYLDIDDEVRRTRYNKNIDLGDWTNLNSTFTESHIHKIKDVADIVVHSDEKPTSISNTIISFLKEKDTIYNLKHEDLFQTKSDLNILSIGQLTEDHYCFVEKIPHSNQFANILKEVVTYGGNATNAAYCFAKLGSNSYLYSQTSKIKSELLLQLLEKDLIRTDYILKNLNNHPKCFMYFTNQENVNFFQFDDIYENLNISIDLNKFDIIFVSGDELLTLQAIKIIKETSPKGLICWSPGYETRYLSKETLMEMMGLSNILIINEDEYNHLVYSIGEFNINETLRFIIKTHGKMGSQLITKHFNVLWGANGQHVRNSYGAGDFFSASFAYKFYKTTDELSSLNFATQMTAFPLSSYISRDYNDEFEQEK